MMPVENVSFRADLRLPKSGDDTPDFSRSATNADDYHCFVLSRGVDRTPWITGHDLKPGVRAMGHHANVHVVPAASAAMLPDRSTVLFELTPVRPPRLAQMVGSSLVLRPDEHEPGAAEPRGRSDDALLSREVVEHEKSV
jgi:hypothetical protein